MTSEIIVSVATDDFSNNAESKSKTIDNKQLINSPVEIVEFNKIDIYNTLQIPDVMGFPIEDFFKTPFTHLVEITKLTDITARYYYIHRTAEEHLSVEMLKKLIKSDAFGKANVIPSIFSKAISNGSRMISCSDSLQMSIQGHRLWPVEKNKPTTK